MRRARLALASLLFACVASADSPWIDVADPVFQRIDQKALPHPAVYAVAQDAAGFIWVGTPGGLARYDGAQFRSCPRSGVQALAADPDGKLWIGTSSSGLACLDLRTERFQTWPAGQGGPRSATVIALARAPGGGCASSRLYDLSPHERIRSRHYEIPFAAELARSAGSPVVS